MNPCYIYWNDIERSKHIDISNKEEIEFVKELCAIHQNSV